MTMDFVEGLLNSRGFGTILVVVDRLNKEAHFISFRHLFTTSNIAKAFIDDMVKLNEIPTSTVTNQDKIFMSNFFTRTFWFIRQQVEGKFFISSTN